MERSCPPIGRGTSTCRAAGGRLGLTLSSGVVTYGHSVTAIAHLYGWHTNRVVTIYKVVAGVKTVIAEEAVGPRGNLAVTLHPSQNTAVFASLEWR